MPIKDKELYNAYMREYLAKRYDKRRQTFLTRLGGKCKVCSSTENLYFSPGPNADTKFNLAKKMNNAPMKKIEAEIVHYSLICASCRAKARK